MILCLLPVTNLSHFWFVFMRRAMIVLTHCSLTVMMWTNNEEQFLLDDLVPFELY